MTNPTRSSQSLRQRLCEHEPLRGSFVKLTGGHSIEILGAVGFDFVVIDAEHGPYGREATDLSLMACRAAGLAGIVRVSDHSRSSLEGALDLGAAGLLVPHVDSARAAEQLVKSCRYQGGRRGFSAATRAGGYGTVTRAEHILRSDSEVALIAMIEDASGLEECDAIAAMNGINAVFIGRGDLAVSLGVDSLDAPEVQNACRRIFEAARAASKPAWAMASSPEEAKLLRDAGASGLILASDTSMLIDGARRLLAA